MTVSLKAGVVVPVLLKIPNVVWMLLLKGGTGSTGSVPLVLTLAENVAQVAVLALPFFVALQLKKNYSTVSPF